MTEKQLFNIAFLHGDLEKVYQTLQDQQKGFINRAETIDKCLLALGIIDKSLFSEVVRYEEKGQEIVINGINKIIKQNK